jgi:hypothetical protein
MKERERILKLIDIILDSSHSDGDFINSEGEKVLNELSRILMRERIFLTLLKKARKTKNVSYLREIRRLLSSEVDS